MEENKVIEQENEIVEQKSETAETKEKQSLKSLLIFSCLIQRYGLWTLRDINSWCNNSTNWQSSFKN